MPDLLAGVPLADMDPDAVQAASATVRRRCRWHIAPSLEETVTIRPTYTNMVFLPTLHLTAVSIVENGVEVPASSYDFTSAGVVRRLNGIWAYAVTVTMTHGYETCPPDVRAAVAGLASKGLVPAAQVRQDTIGPYTTAYYETADPLTAVDAYRLP